MIKLVTIEVDSNENEKKKSHTHRIKFKRIANFLLINILVSLFQLIPMPSIMILQHFYQTHLTKIIINFFLLPSMKIIQRLSLLVLLLHSFFPYKICDEFFVMGNMMMIFSIHGQNVFFLRTIIVFFAFLSLCCLL